MAFTVEIPEGWGASLPPVAGRTVMVGPITVPGIVTGAAYADGDAIGTKFVFPNVFRPVKHSGIIHTALYYDLDDEGLAVDLHLFSSDITSGTDNSAFAPTDTDIANYVGTLAFTSFSNLGNNQVSQLTNVGLVVVSRSPNLTAQVVARGTLNIAAGNLPAFSLICLQD